MLSSARSVKKTKWPSGSTATPHGLGPAVYGLPAASVSTPVAPTWKTINTPLHWSLTNNNVPDGETFTSLGQLPTSNGEPATWVSAPVSWLTLSTATPPPSPPATKTNLPSRVTSSVPWQQVPVANGEPATEVSAPVSGLTRNAATVISSLSPNKNRTPDCSSGKRKPSPRLEHPINTPA